jgi:hypothetical protein
LNKANQNVNGLNDKIAALNDELTKAQQAVKSKSDDEQQELLDLIEKLNAENEALKAQLSKGPADGASDCGHIAKYRIILFDNNFRQLEDKLKEIAEHEGVVQKLDQKWDQLIGAGKDTAKWRQDAEKELG